MENALLFTFSSMVDAETRAFLHDHNVSSLAKPFEVADLISHVRALAHKHDKPAPHPAEPKATSASAGA